MAEVGVGEHGDEDGDDRVQGEPGPGGGGKEGIPSSQNFVCCSPKRTIGAFPTPGLLQFCLKPRDKDLLCRTDFTERQKEGEGGKGIIHVRCFSFFKKKSHQGSHYNFIISRKTK